MTFEKVAVDYGKESETDKDGNYSITITIGLKDSRDKIPPFSKDITVVSNNSMTGFAVDVQRKQAIDDFINDFNK